MVGFFGNGPIFRLLITTCVGHGKLLKAGPRRPVLVRFSAVCGRAWPLEKSSRIQKFRKVKIYENLPIEKPTARKTGP